MEKIVKPKNDIHFRLGIIKEAESVGLNWLSEAFLVYQELRWYETDGRFHICVAGVEKLGEPYGLTAEQVNNHLQFLQRKGLVEHVWCDKKVYKNKTKLWVSLAKISGYSSAVDIVRVLKRGKKNTHYLSTENGQLNGEICFKTTDGSVETTDGSVEGADGSVVCSGEERGSELYNELNNKLFITKVIKDEHPESEEQISKVDVKNRKLNEKGEVVGGNVLTEKSYELWQEIMGQPCKRDKWNSRAGWNMMRAKNKGENWLRAMLMIARECKKDQKADYRASHVASLADLQKYQDQVIDWYRKKKLEKETSSNKALDNLWKIR